MIFFFSRIRSHKNILAVRKKMVFCVFLYLHVCVFGKLATMRKAIFVATTLYETLSEKISIVSLNSLAAKLGLSLL